MKQPWALLIRVDVQGMLVPLLYLFWGHGLSLLRSYLGAKILSLQLLLYNVSLEMVTAVKWHLKSLTLAGISILILRTFMESVSILLKYLSEHPKK